MAAPKFVTYTSTKGHEKPAIVLVDADTYNEGTSLDAPAEGTAHLLVFGLSGASSRFNVPTQANAVANENGELRNFFA